MKGLPQSLSTIQCRLPEPGDWMTDFNGHSKPEFWQNRSGRLGINGNCSIIAPTFEINRKYVLIFGIRPDVKQFEQVADIRDKWVEYIDAFLVTPEK